MPLKWVCIVMWNKIIIEFLFCNNWSIIFELILCYQYNFIFLLEGLSVIMISSNFALIVMNDRGSIISTKIWALLFSSLKPFGQTYWIVSTRIFMLWGAKSLNLSTNCNFKLKDISSSIFYSSSFLGSCASSFPPFTSKLKFQYVNY